MCVGKGKGTPLLTILRGGQTDFDDDNAKASPPSVMISESDLDVIYLPYAK